MLVRRAASQTAKHVTIESRLRVRTDLLGQPLVGSGEYAQLESSGGVLLRMELAIQAGEQATSVKQLSDGRHLWEHWRIGDSERVNHVDLRRVRKALHEAGGVAVGATSNLASGGLPKLLQQLEANFDFSQSKVRSGKLASVPVWSTAGTWKPARIASAAPEAVTGQQVELHRLPSHVPHRVELLIGQKDLFPYRVTYYRQHEVDGKRTWKPVVTTEFFEVAIGESLDPTQFHYRQPTNLSVADRTDAFIHALGIRSPGEPVKPGMATRSSSNTSPR